MSAEEKEARAKRRRERDKRKPPRSTIFEGPKVGRKGVVESQFDEQRGSGAFDPDVQEWINACAEAKKLTGGRPLRISEYFDIAWSLGYRKQAQEKSA
jgi:hypothetical protein